MTFDNITNGLKLSMLLASVLKDPEEALLKAIEDFRHADNAEVTEIKKSLCKKLGCEDINIVPGDTSIFVEFVGIKESLEVFVINLVGFAYKLLDKTKLLISMFVPDVDVNNILKQLSVTNNETTNTVAIEFPGREGMITIEMNYDPERETASIEIPVKSEKVINELKEMKEE